MAPAQIISVMKAFADEACACAQGEHVMNCLKDLRNQYNAQKARLAPNPSFTAADRTALTAEGARMAGCGDGGGVTFW